MEILLELTGLFSFQGTCQYGSECRFEHPGQNPAPPPPAPFGEYRNYLPLRSEILTSLCEWGSYSSHKVLKNREHFRFLVLRSRRKPDVEKPGTVFGNKDCRIVLISIESVQRRKRVDKKRGSKGF